MGQKSNLRPFVESFIGTSLDDDEAYNFDLEDLLKIRSLPNQYARKSWEAPPNTRENIRMSISITTQSRSREGLASRS
jgi:hypothetical protein